MAIEYTHSRPVSADQYIDILKRSTLAERRPVDDPERIEAMLRNTNLHCTAWDGAKLIGVARSVTDFVYCCYMSDLAVDAAWQKKGVGRELIRVTQNQLGPKCQIILLAAPKAEGYYPRIGFSRHNSAWLLASRKPI